MSSSAWIMMLATWTVISAFTVRYFWLVLTKDKNRGVGESPKRPSSTTMSN